MCVFVCVGGLTETPAMQGVERQVVERCPGLTDIFEICGDGGKDRLVLGKEGKSEKVFHTSSDESSGICYLNC